MEQLYFYGKEVSFEDERLKKDAEVYFLDPNTEHLIHATVTHKTGISICVETNDKKIYILPAAAVENGAVRLV